MVFILVPVAAAYFGLYSAVDGKRLMCAIEEHKSEWWDWEAVLSKGRLNRTVPVSGKVRQAQALKNTDSIYRTGNGSGQRKGQRLEKHECVFQVGPVQGELTSSYKPIGSYCWSRQSCDSRHDSGHHYYKDGETFKEEKETMSLIFLNLPLPRTSRAKHWFGLWCFEWE